MSENEKERYSRTVYDFIITFFLEKRKLCSPHGAAIPERLSPECSIELKHLPGKSPMYELHYTLSIRVSLIFQVSVKECGIY